MNWGYRGTGETNIAESILVDYLESPDSPHSTIPGNADENAALARALRDEFKEDFLPHNPAQNWEITGDDIALWLREPEHAYMIKAGVATSLHRKAVRLDDGSEHIVEDSTHEGQIKLAAGGEASPERVRAVLPRPR